jgi:hypothetical protein
MVCVYLIHSLVGTQCQQINQRKRASIDTNYSTIMIYYVSMQHKLTVHFAMNMSLCPKSIQPRQRVSSTAAWRALTSNM